MNKLNFSNYWYELLEKNVKRSFRDYVATRDFVRDLKIKNTKEWYKFCKSGNKPVDIPRNPDRKYKESGWNSWSEFLGTKNISTKKMKFRNFESARKFVRKLELVNEKEWKTYYKSGKKPTDIPSAPNRTYKNKGWKGMGDWLGTGRIAPQLKKYRDFKLARKFVRKLDLANEKEWREYCKSGKKPEDIPSNPQGTYKDKGWKGIRDWLIKK